MSEFLSSVYYGNTVAQWLSALLLIGGAFVAAKIVYYILGTTIKQLTSRTRNKLDDLIVDMVEEPLVLIVTVFGIGYGLNTLQLPDRANDWIGNGMQFTVVLAIAWLIARLLDAVYQEYLTPLADKSDNKLDDQLLPIVRRVTRFIVWSLGIIIALNNAGYDVAALIAGLGIGGLALAMAAKDTVSNIFGGFTVFTDKPFQIGDRIKIDGFDGTIKEIGMRSTRLQTLEGRIVTIPNSRFSEAAVENVSLEPTRKVVMTLGLTYDMTAQQMEEAMQLLADLADKEDRVNDDAKVAFTGFGDFSMNILFIYYINPGEDILGTQTAMNLAILREFTSRGLEMAFPTQTIHTKAAQ